MKTLKIHKAWIVFIALILIQSGTYGVIVNCMGIVFSAIIDDMNFRAGDLSIYYTLRSVSSAFSMVFVMKMFFKYNTKIVMGILGIISITSIACMYGFTELWQWYISAIFTGLLVGCVPLIMPLVLNNWFKVNNGLVIGCVSAASGISGAIIGPICSYIITEYGWRNCVLFITALCVILILIPSITLLISSPEKINDTALGVEKYQGKVSEKTDVIGVQPHWIFFACLFINAFVGILVQFANQLPTYAVSINYTLAIGAVFTSLVMVGNVIGKIVIGILADKFGIYFAMITVLIIVVISFFLYIHYTEYLPIMYIASFMYGNIYAITNIAPPLLLLELYKEGGYRKKLARVQSISMIVIALLGISIPYSYDITGSFVLVFNVGIAIIIFSIIILLYMKKISLQSLKEVFLSTKYKTPNEV